MSYTSEVLADSPLVYLHLDETSGTALADASGNSHGFTLGGGTLNQATVMPSGVASVNLNSTSEYCTATSASWMNVTSFTVEAWIKLTATSSYHALASRDSNTSRGWTCYINGGKLDFFDSGGNDHLGTTTLSTGTAYHVVFTYDSATSTAKVYLNGTLDGTFTSVTISNANWDMFLGDSRAGTAGSLFFPLTGNLDEFAYYNGALSATRITAHYNAATATVVLPPAGAATADATAPSIAAGAVVTPPAGAATAAATPPVITAGGGDTIVTPPAGAATAGATAPVLAAGVNVTPPAAAATADATGPSIVDATVISLDTLQFGQFAMLDPDDVTTSSSVDHSDELLEFQFAMLEGLALIGPAA